MEIVNDRNAIVEGLDEDRLRLVFRHITYVNRFSGGDMTSNQSKNSPKEL